MSRAGCTYPDDAPHEVGLRTSHAPNETMTSDAARRLARELIDAADECDMMNAKRELP